ncbi:hypothetical protein [Owenweeksia hongkongensis]|uniref:hypothetical protein n=1 Tax=Owenweeksia hongkongensis TaxID=253245 RepID=UPI003A939976
MDKEGLIKYLEYISDLCSKELSQGSSLQGSVVQKELEVLEDRLYKSDIAQEIAGKINSIYIDDTLSEDDDLRYFYGLLPRLRPYRDEEKRKRGLLDLKGKIDHMIIEMKSET